MAWVASLLIGDADSQALTCHATKACSCREGTGTEREGTGTSVSLQASMGGHVGWLVVISYTSRRFEALSLTLRREW
jgi:hypothetical protein